MENNKKQNQPTIEQLIEWLEEGWAEAIDGCGPLELDGYCIHGKPSWLIELGMI